MNRHRKRLWPLFLCVALGACASLFAEHQKIAHTPGNRMADAVLQNLLSSPLGKLAPRLHYKVTLIDGRYPNAFSNYQGEIYIMSGLFPVLDGDSGVWAAVIGHELGHVVLHHPHSLPRFESELRRAYQEARAKGYDQGPMEWPKVRLGEGISRLKLSRKEELQADFIGLMLMAEAGYQPGFAMLLDQRLRFGLGDTPSIMAIFSHHPRLETREEHTKKFYNIAMDIFRLRWPDAAKSPGGNLPPYGAIGRWTFEQKDGGRQLVFDVSFQVHNAANTKVRVAAFFLNGDLRVRSAEPKFRATDGSLVLNAFMLGAADKSAEVTLQVPRSAIETPERKLKAVVFLMAGKRALDMVTENVELSGR